MKKGMGQEKGFEIDKFPDIKMGEFYDEEHREIKSIENGKISSFYGVIQEESDIVKDIEWNKIEADKKSERWKYIGGTIGFVIAMICVVTSGSFGAGLPAFVILVPTLIYFGSKGGKYFANKYFTDRNLLSKQGASQATKLQTLTAEKDSSVADIHEKFEKMRQDYRDSFESVAKEHADSLLQKEDCLEIFKEVKKDLGETIGIGNGLMGAETVSGHYSAYFYRNAIVTTGIYRNENMVSREPVDIYAWALAAQKYIEDNSDGSLNIKTEVKIVRTSVELAIEY